MALVCLCGVPGAGKTRLRAALLETLRRERPPSAPTDTTTQPTATTTAEAVVTNVEKRYGVRVVGFDDVMLEEQKRSAALRDERGEQKSGCERMDKLLGQSPDKEAGEGEGEGEEDMVPGGWNVVCWRRARQDAIRRVRDAIAKRDADDGDTRVVIVDDNMQYTSMRREVWQIARNADPPVGFLVVWLRTSLETALRRNAARRPGHGRVDEDVVRKLYRILEEEPPGGRDKTRTQHHRFEKDSVLVLDGDSDLVALQSVVDAIGHAVQHPVAVAVPAAAAAAPSNPPSRRAAADACCRRVTSLLMERVVATDGISSTTRGRLAKALSAAKKHTVRGLQSHIQTGDQTELEANDDSEDGAVADVFLQHVVQEVLASMAQTPASELELVVECVQSTRS